MIHDTAVVLAILGGNLVSFGVGGWLAWLATTSRYRVRLPRRPRE